MSDFLELLADNDSAAGLAVTTAAIVVVGGVLRFVLGRVFRRRFADDRYRRYWAPKLVSYGVGFVAVVALIALWAPLGGRLTVILGFATAGVAFAMQEVIGALFGWINVLTGRIYTVGDRIEMAGVRGDVLDIAPLRTKLLEIGRDPRVAADNPTWVGARQPTGRVVSLSNKKTFTEPVFNFSAHLDWVWEELSITVAPDADWRRAEQLLLEEITRHEPELRRHGEEELARMAERYLVSRAEVEPRTFVRLADGDLELTGRFVVRVRDARGAKDTILRALLDRLAQERIPLAYPTYSIAPSSRSEHGKGARAGVVAADRDRGGGRGAS